MGRSGDRPIPMLAGVALTGAGVLFLGYAFFQYASIANDPSYAGVGWRDTYEMRDVARGMLLGVALVTLGIVVVALRLRDRLRAPRVPRGAERGAETAPASHPAPAQTRPAPQPVPAPAPRADSSPKRPDGGISPLDQVLPRSDDALATLRYFIEDAPAQMLPDQCELVRRTGLADWSGEPRCAAGKLTRSGRWRLFPSGGRPAPDDTDRIWAIEAALNLGQDAARMPDPPATADERARALLAGVARLEPVRHPGSRFRDALCEGAADQGEWAVRLAFADCLNNLPAPFRMIADFRLNVSEGLLGVRVAVPRPAAFRFMREAERAPLACAYAYDLALLVARTAFDASPTIRRAAVDCHEAGGPDCVLSVELTRSSIERAVAAPREGGLPEPSAELRVRRRADGWLEPVESLLPFADAALCPPGRSRPVELDDEPCPEAVVRACGARRRPELGIAESVVRWDAWERVADDFGGLGDTTEDAVAALSGLRASATDATVVEACERTVRALISGELDVEDVDGLIECFVDGFPLQRAVRRAAPLAMSADADPDEVADALSALEDEIARFETRSLPRDDERVVYRYFRSVPERVTYNLDLADGRVVRLVPDAYALAHQYASMLGRRAARPGSLDRALAHAERAAELAPCTVETSLARADCLRDLGRVDEAVRVASEAAERCATVEGLSLCLYRLAGLTYDLGMVEASVACYRRCIELGGDEVAVSARRELSVLVEHEHEALAASRLDPASLTGDRLAAVLEGSGLPAGSTERISARLLAAAVACVDAGIFSSADALLRALLQDSGYCDDALFNVLGSIAN